VILPLSCLPTDSYALASGRVVTHADYPLLEKIAESAIKDRQKFERLVVSKENLLEMFYVS
jgi:threonyl-tRNA synthetase